MKSRSTKLEVIEKEIQNLQTLLEQKIEGKH